MPHEEPPPAIPPVLKLFAICLCSGANDLGGTLMNESMRAAGAIHGEEIPPEAMEDLIGKLGDGCASEPHYTRWPMATEPHDHSVRNLWSQ